MLQRVLDTHVAAPQKLMAMQTLIRLTISMFLSFAFATALQAQGSSPAAKSGNTDASKATDVYHVFFGYAAPGKAADLAEFLKTPDPTAPQPGHSIILRHQDGDAWDYVAIEHLGTKATVDIPANMMTSAQRALMAKHDDTFVSGPAWAEFTKELGIDSNASKTAGSVYVVSVYRAAPGHRDDLAKVLSEPPNRATDTSSGAVLMTHLEGGAWNYLSVIRYDSWEKFATNEKNSIAQTNKKEGGWFQLREHISFHNDTLTDRILP
jgi:hypothetical protein